MSETKHSPEPWAVEGDTVVDAKRSILVESPWTYPGDDLRRIVACVNACAGIPTEALEAGALGKAIDAAENLHDFAFRMRDAHLIKCTYSIGQALRALGRLP